MQESVTLSVNPERREGQCAMSSFFHLEKPNQCDRNTPHWVARRVGIGFLALCRTEIQHGQHGSHFLCQLLRNAVNQCPRRAVRTPLPLCEKAGLHLPAPSMSPELRPRLLENAHFIVFLEVPWASLLVDIHSVIISRVLWQMAWRKLGTMPSTKPSCD